MRLAKTRVRGFQSFGDSGEVEFSAGVNLIIGQNNAGKTALLRALLPALTDDRHRTPATWQAAALPEPRIELTIDVSGAEIRGWMLTSGAQPYVPIPKSEHLDATAFMKEFFERPSIPVSVSRVPNSGSFSSPYPSHQLFQHVAGTGKSCARAVLIDGQLRIYVGEGSDTLPALLWQAWQRDMFYFAAERMVSGESPPGHATRLRPDAGNLPNVLHTLNGERGDLFRQLVHHLRDVFPTVGNVSVRTKPGTSNLEVRVWPTEAMEQVDLSFPLDSGGTGVAQLIALLTTIMTIDNAVIIIDEISSFLHPAAVKALLRIMQTQYTQHQYIIATHAPEVISFSNPKTIHLVKRAGYESSVERLDLAKVGELREVAEHLGVSMADVFAADRVIWVEGPTEELCFPYVLQRLKEPLPRGTIFTSVAATGDFNTRKRDPAIVFEVYSRLSAAAATLVVSVVFSFDTERLTDAEKEEMRRRSGGLLHFLPRRHLECYLIDPTAIAAFIASRDGGSAESATPEAVEIALQAAAAERPLVIEEWNNDITDAVWLARVDAANLLVKVCGILSEQRVPFAKKEDSLFLLRHIVGHNPGRLAALGDYVASLVAAVAPGEQRPS